jgi:hypothetical protein
MITTLKYLATRAGGITHGQINVKRILELDEIKTCDLAHFLRWNDIVGPALRRQKID